MAYFSTFKSCIRLHRDCVSKCQVDETSVLVVTFGDAMELCLVPPKEAGVQNRKGYSMALANKVTLDNLSVFVLDPEDDKKNMHCVRFRGTAAGRVRFALVFRWLHKRALFCGHSNDVRSHAMLDKNGKLKQLLKKNWKKTADKWLDVLGMNQNAE